MTPVDRRVLLAKLLMCGEVFRFQDWKAAVGVDVVGLYPEGVDTLGRLLDAELITRVGYWVNGIEYSITPKGLAYIKGDYHGDRNEDEDTPD